MHLGLSTSVLGLRALPEGLALLAECRTDGAPWVEIHGYVTEEFDYADARLVAATARALARHGLRLWSCHSPAGPPLDVTALDREVVATSLQVMRQAMQAAADLGAQVFVCDAMGRSPQTSEERAARQAVLAANAARLQEDADRLGLRLVIENHSWPEAVFKTPQDFLALAGRPGLDRLGACWDTGHGWITGQAPHTAARLGARLVTLHVHDNTGERDLHLVPMEGTAPWEGFVPVLRAAGYDGPLMFELGPPHPATPEAVRAVLRRAVAAYRRLLADAT